MATHVINGYTINMIGDVHLGRVFRSGVPFHRLGHREEMVWEQFADEVRKPADVTVIMGDLFDKFVVPPEVVLRAYTILVTQLKNPMVILRGNHDASRETDRKSSFDLLEQLLINVDDVDITMVTGVTLKTFRQLNPRISPKVRELCLLFCGWDPEQSAAKQLQVFLPQLNDKRREGIQAVFGHWDVTQHGENDHSTIPLDEIEELGCRLVFNGHVHKPDVLLQRGITINLVGSMLPYAHGEEADGQQFWYATLTPVEVEATLAGDEEAFRNMNVRILLEDGESYGREFDCLSRIFKRLPPKAQEATNEANPDTFDLQQTLRTTLQEHNVSEALQAVIFDSISEKMNHD